MTGRIMLRTILSASLALAAGAANAVHLSDVPNANAKVVGQTAPNALSQELTAQLTATGSMALENPSALTAYYGYDAVAPDSTVFVPALGTNVEASKSEPDKNTYLRLRGQSGPDANYHYGVNFLFQGHELGLHGYGYITRINLDADAAHRVTLMADTDVSGNPLPTYDGSTWDPFAHVLLFTSEVGTSGGVWQATPGYPSQVTDISAFLGRGGYEGIQVDGDGNIWIVEDVGGSSGSGANNRARRPNSFIYRFVPNDRRDLTKGGTLEALQVRNKSNSAPITFDAAETPDVAAFSQDVADLHTYGNSFATQWVALTLDSTLNANAAAKAAGATPFKRPENGVFQPGTRFSRFFFTETGDTNMDSSANAGFGGYGGVFELILPGGPSATKGRLKPFYLGDLKHTGLDNIQFFTMNQLMVVEDAGDTLHTQRNALDSGYILDTREDYGDSAVQPLRFLAEGRDASATIDSALLGSAGYQNDGDNEITGIHVSDGDPTVFGLLGAKIPLPFQANWRVFFNQQHGDNNSWEIVPR